MTSVDYSKDGAVGVVTLCKPPHNLIDNAMLEALANTYEQALGEGCRAILLRSSMRHFCAGADLDRLASEQWSRAQLQQLWARLEDVPSYHVRQMAAYAAALAVIFPGRVIEAALLYTAGPVLIALPAGLLEAHKPGFAGREQSLPASR